MTWQLWIVVGLFLTNAVMQPLTIGDTDKPKSPEVAAFGVVFYLLLAGLVIWGAR